MFELIADGKPCPVLLVAIDEVASKWMDRWAFLFLGMSDFLEMRNYGPFPVVGMDSEEYPIVIYVAESLPNWEATEGLFSSFSESHLKILMLLDNTICGQVQKADALDSILIPINNAANDSPEIALVVKDIILQICAPSVICVDFSDITMMISNAICKFGRFQFEQSIKKLPLKVWKSTDIARQVSKSAKVLVIPTFNLNASLKEWSDFAQEFEELLSNNAWVVVGRIGDLDGIEMKSESFSLIYSVQKL